MRQAFVLVLPFLIVVGGGGRAVAAVGVSYDLTHLSIARGKGRGGRERREGQQ